MLAHVCADAGNYGEAVDGKKDLYIEWINTFEYDH
jgi:hypothetical protein